MDETNYCGSVHDRTAKMSPQKRTHAEHDRNFIMPNENDILSGRGGLTNHHRGNLLFRRLIAIRKDLYCRLSEKHKKVALIQSIVEVLKQRGARFLKLDHSTHLWLELSEKEAFEKTCQALRDRHRRTSIVSRSGTRYTHDNLVSSRYMSTASASKKGAGNTSSCMHESLKTSLLKQSLLPCKSPANEVTPSKDNNDIDPFEFQSGGEVDDDGCLLQDLLSNSTLDPLLWKVASIEDLHSTLGAKYNSTLSDEGRYIDTIDFFF